MALLDVKPYDKHYYETVLKPFLPKKFIDCHAHIWLPEHNPNDHLREGSQNWPRLVAKNANSIEELNETNRLLFPDNEVVSVLYGDCAVSVDRTAINKYVADKTDEVIFTGDKNLTGRELLDGEFSFILKDATGATVEIVKNDANGKIAFAGITFERAGVYTYTISEVKGALGGVTYDTKGTK